MKYAASRYSNVELKQYCQKQHSEHVESHNCNILIQDLLADYERDMMQYFYRYWLLLHHVKRISTNCQAACLLK